MRKSPRDRRLNSDFQSVQQLQDESTIFSFQATGNPPQKYRLIFTGAGFQRDRHGTITVSSHHEVLVELGAAYPRMVPNLAWQTPIFHPNISNNGVVCLGGYGTHWVPSLTLSEMCTMLWDMIRYKNFDSDSPYNREAALWAKVQTEFELPIDPRSIRDRISNQAEVIQDAKRLDEVQVARVVNDDQQSIAANPSDDAGDALPFEVTEVDVLDKRGDDGVIEHGIEIIETGIEIIDINFEKRDTQTPNDGIIFLD